MTKPKILFIGSFKIPAQGTWDVSETIAKSLDRAGYQVRLVSYYENKYVRLFDIILNIIFFRGECIHINVFSGQAFIITEVSVRLSNLLKKKIILTLHGGALNFFEEKNKTRVRNALRKATVIQTPSNFLRKYFCEKGYDVSYMPNPIELNKFPYSKNTNFDRRILWVRAFAEIYNPELPILILDILRKTYPDVKLTMIGPDKGLLDKCKKLAISLNLLQSINFLGPVQNDNLFRYFQSHTVYINTTSYESFGTAILEAAACGIPIVSYKVGEIPYIWTNEVNILLVEELKPELFAKAIIRIFERPTFAQKLSLGARKKAEDFDWEHIKPKWLQLLNEYYAR